MFQGGRPLGWPEGGYPAPPGAVLLAASAPTRSSGGRWPEAHLDACLAAGLKIYGINAEVMPGQWEFQVGTAGPLEVADHLTLARWLLFRVGEDHGVSMTLHPKPMRGDWNGAGAHTNFSTRAMREEGGLAHIRAAMDKLAARPRPAHRELRRRRRAAPDGPARDLLVQGVQVRPIRPRRVDPDPARRRAAGPRLLRGPQALRQRRSLRGDAGCSSRTVLET